MSPRTKEQFDEARNASIQRIVDAAMKLFSSDGYIQVSVSDIAKEAGISQGLMYNYFKSKDKLLLHIIKTMIAEMDRQMLLLQEVQTPHEKLNIIIRSCFQGLREKKEFWRMVLPIVSQQSVSGKLGNVLGNYFGTAVLQFEKIFKALKKPSPKMEAWKLGAILDGIAWHYLYIFPDDYPLDQMERKLLKDYNQLTK